ncbi:ParA family protein [Luxibacter massiliensis]|uniref:ParA family protein n=1 Tax=Luxibacter massiliensis TaxID=2219695 RepID=UPI000F04B157|nr:ParA family protein [Luxibacter massiliensis]
MATIIALTNQKGGVGKTTTSSALAAGLASFYDKKVLAIDLDPQGSLGFSLGLDIEDCSNIYDVLKGSVSISEAIQTTDYCDIVTSNILLSSAELEFTSTDRELLLKKALAPVVANYDYIIIDTPPALNILTVNAYASSDHLIIPMAPEILSLLGVTQLKETIDSVRQSLNSSLHVLGIILTRYNGRTLLAREVKEMAENIASQIGTCVFRTQIRPSVTVAEAPAHGVSVFEHAPRSNPSLDYQDFVGEVLSMIEKKQTQEVQ